MYMVNTTYIGKWAEFKCTLSVPLPLTIAVGKCIATSLTASLIYKLSKIQINEGSSCWKMNI
jgi:hypothetical protein